MSPSAWFNWRSSRGTAVAPNGGSARVLPDGASDPLEALLKLSRTLGIWKENFGILRVVQVRPNKLGREFRPNCDLKCRYRFLREGVWGQWAEADPIPQPGGGIHLYVRGVQDDEAFIQVEILKNQSPHWRSPATPQYVNVKMQLLEERP